MQKKDQLIERGKRYKKTIDNIKSFTILFGILSYASAVGFGNIKFFFVFALCMAITYIPIKYYEVKGRKILGDNVYDVCDMEIIPCCAIIFSLIFPPAGFVLGIVGCSKKEKYSWFALPLSVFFGMIYLRNLLDWLEMGRIILFV